MNALGKGDARAPGEAPSTGHFVSADLSTLDGPAELARATVEMLGGVDILIDNVGTQTRVPDGVLAMTDADWLRDLSGSLLSAVRLDRALLPGMIAQGGRGDRPYRVQRCAAAPGESDGRAQHSRQSRLPRRHRVRRSGATSATTRRREQH